MPYRSSGLSKVQLAFFILAVFILNLFYFPRSIKADYIYLKDGSIISGILIEEKEELLIYRAAYGEMFINRKNVSKIVRESRDKPLLREAERYLKDRKFKWAIKTCGEVLEIKPDSVEALELKQKTVNAWQKYETEREERVYKEKEKRERMARELGNMQATLKAKCGIAIRKEKDNYVIADVYYNCPLVKGEIKPGDTLAAIHGTKLARLSIKKVCDLLVTLKKINLTVERPVVLIREKILWRGTKEYVGLGISIEKVDKGIKITNLMPDGPAAKAGLLKDDIITTLGGRIINSSSMDEIITILKGRAGTKLKAIILRVVILN